MPIIVPNEGEKVLQDRLLRTALAVDEGQYLRLFQNDYEPDEDTVLADFTEASFTGYSQKSLIRSSWNPSTIVSGVAVSTYGSSPQVWTCGATGNTVYGYYIVGVVSNKVEWCQRFTDPIVLSDGLQLGITPTFSGQSEY